MSKALLSITARWGAGQDRVVIRVTDEAIGDEITEIMVSYEEFGRALTGDIHRPCEMIVKRKGDA